MRSMALRLSILCLAVASADCAADSASPARSASAGDLGDSTGGSSGSGGSPSSGSSDLAGQTGEEKGKGGTTASGGSKASGGSTGEQACGSHSGGAAGKAPQPQAGGATAAGGQTNRGSGGSAIPGSGGKAGTGGAIEADSGGPVDCSAAMPTGGTDHCGQNTQGKAGDQTWSLWSNANNSNGCITTFSTPAFSARWNGNNDFLARIGLEFGNSSKTYDQYGTLKADFSFKKTGSAGGYSYIGIYGWTTNPCVEWYIVDDRFGTMPFNAYNATGKGTVKVDGSDYKIFQNKTNGTGGSRCSGVSQWDQYWSIRQAARQCGTITISDHFKAWEAAGLKMGGLLEAKILVETGGDSGSIEFPVAKVTAQ